LIHDALACGVPHEVQLLAEQREERARELEARGLSVARAAPAAMSRASGLVTPPGIVALARAPRPAPLAAPGPGALVLVVAGVADPGNLGALARSAEAAGADALVCIAGGASPWSAKALRGSMGSLLRLPVHSFASSAAARDELARLGYRQVCAETRGGLPPERVDWRGPIALWIGPETGCAPDWSGFTAVTLPMAGRVESLNVTVAAALLLFAARRAQGGP
jgi:TrmH family RNA methyltransferase